MAMSPTTHSPCYAASAQLAVQYRMRYLKHCHRQLCPQFGCRPMSTCIKLVLQDDDDERALRGREGLCGQELLVKDLRGCEDISKIPVVDANKVYNDIVRTPEICLIMSLPGLRPVSATCGTWMVVEPAGGLFLLEAHASTFHINVDLQQQGAAWHRTYCGKPLGLSRARSTPILRDPHGGRSLRYAMTLYALPGVWTHDVALRFTPGVGDAQDTRRSTSNPYRP